MSKATCSMLTDPVKTPGFDGEVLAIGSVLEYNRTKLGTLILAYNDDTCVYQWGVPLEYIRHSQQRVLENIVLPGLRIQVLYEPK